MKKLSIKKEDGNLLDLQCHASNIVELAGTARKMFDERDSIIAEIREQFDSMESIMLEL